MLVLVEITDESSEIYSTLKKFLKSHYLFVLIVCLWNKSISFWGEENKQIIALKSFPKTVHNRGVINIMLHFLISSKSHFCVLQY